MEIEQYFSVGSISTVFKCRCHRYNPMSSSVSWLQSIEWSKCCSPTSNPIHKIQIHSKLQIHFMTALLDYLLECLRPVLTCWPVHRFHPRLQIHFSVAIVPLKCARQLRNWANLVHSFERPTRSFIRVRKLARFFGMLCLGCAFFQGSLRDSPVQFIVKWANTEVCCVRALLMRSVFKTNTSLAMFFFVCTCPPKLVS